MADEDVAQRLRSMLVNAADGRRSIGDDSEYPELRRKLKKRLDRRGIEVPGLISTYKSIDALMVYLKELGPKPARVARVHDAFRELLHQITDEPAPHSSSAWTGRTTVQEQAAQVRSLAPAAISAIDDLLAEQELRHSNHGPVDPAEQAAIDQLRELRDALDELIGLAEADQPLADKAKRLVDIAARAMAAFTGSLAQDIQCFPIAASTLGITALTYTIASALAPDAAGVLAGTAGTAFGAKRLLLPAENDGAKGGMGVNSA